MTAGGWLLLVVSWSLIVGMLVFCFHRIFSRRVEPDSGHQE